MEWEGLLTLMIKCFYKYHKMEIVNTIIREYKEADDARRKELIDIVAVAFNINTIAIYDRTELTKHILYGDQRMTDDDGSFFKEDNYIPNFREDGIFVIDNINFLKQRLQQYIKCILNTELFRLSSTLSVEILRRITILFLMEDLSLIRNGQRNDMNFLAIIGDYIGRIFLKERKHD